MKKKHKIRSPIFKDLLSRRNSVTPNKKDKSKDRNSKIAQKKKNKDINE
jgi:hypothetical protein